MYLLRPAEDLVVEAVEGIDQWLTKYALKKQEKKYHYLSVRRIDVYHLHVILAEIKRLRKLEEEQREHKNEARRSSLLDAA